MAFIDPGENDPNTDQQTGDITLQDYPEEDSTANLYAWYNSSINTFKTVYTTSETPTSGDHIYYDVSLNQVISNPTADYYYMSGTSVSSVSGTTLTTTSNTTYDRDASRDIIRSVNAESSDITPNATLYIGSQAFIPVFYTIGSAPKYNATIDNVLGDVDSNGVLQAPSVTTNLIFNGVEDIGDYVLYYKFNKNTGITAVSFPDLTEISGVTACRNMFDGCTSLITADLSALTTISGSMGCNLMFNGCTGLTTADLSSLVIVSGSNGCHRMFYNCSALTAFDLSSLTTINSTNGCTQMFCNCASLTTANLSSLVTVSGINGCAEMFSGCIGLLTADLSSLTTLSNSSICDQMFDGCTSLITADLRSLTTLSGYGCCRGMFGNCSSLTTVDLSSLANVNNYYTCQAMFHNCPLLTTLSFPSLNSNSFGSYTNQFNSMLTRCTGVTVHFPSNLQSVIGSWSDVTAGFGGTNTTVLFDLPATN